VAHLATDFARLLAMLAVCHSVRGGSAAVALRRLRAIADKVTNLATILASFVGGIAVALPLAAALTLAFALTLALILALVAALSTANRWAIVISFGLATLLLEVACLATDRASFVAAWTVCDNMRS